MFLWFQVGMSIDPKLLVAHFPVIIGTLALLIGGKTVLVVVLGRFFGISLISAIRVGLLLAPGGEFAFVAFGEAVNQVFLPISNDAHWSLITCLQVEGRTGVVLIGLVYRV